MAFRQSTHHAPQRQVIVPDPPQPTNVFSEVQNQRPLDESQEWVLFEPAAPSIGHTATTSTDRTRTAGLSRLSDFGSLDTGAALSNDEEEGSTSAAVEHGHAAVDNLADHDEEEELDSLDSHLHAFREPSIYRRRSRDQRGATVLPTHDGLGTFPASSPPVQEHLYQFEQYNPRQRPRTSSAVEVMADDAEESTENDRTRRIQEWRMEQSRVLLDEIETETRRRRRSRAGDMENDDAPSAISHHGLPSTEIAGTAKAVEPASEHENEASEENESFWKRITRRVIRDLIGIDKTILSVIFGESFVDESEPSQSSSRSMAEEPQHNLDIVPAQLDGSWEDRLLERLARELGTLVHQLSEHPGAFSTYLRTQETPDFVGRTTPVRKSSFDSSPEAPLAPVRVGDSFNTLNSSATSGPHFFPTIPEQGIDLAGNDALWGIDEAPLSPDRVSMPQPTQRSEAELLRLEREYWERELDVSMVFSFLRNRFRRHGPSPMTHSTLATSSPQSTAARAAMIRQQHPLISRTQNEHRRTSGALYRRGSVVGVKRPSSSCASQSERSRKTRGSGSSRHYWDIGTSVGSGSVVAGTAGLGSWGEV